MKLLLLLLLVICLGLSAQAQSVQQLYASRDYRGLVQREPEAAKLTADELYMVGFAFFQLENDTKAIAFYDKAIAKGLQNGSVHFYKGLSLRLLHQYPEALQELETALKLEPANQEFMNEKGLVFYRQDQLAQALAVFEQAKKLPNTYLEPYYWAARIHHENQEFAQALAGYYEAVKLLPTTNSQYQRALEAIGLLEYTTTLNYQKSAAAYTAAIALDKENYPLYYKLIKAYNAGRAYPKADSVFALVKAAFEQGRLPKEDQEVKSIAVAQFTWNKQVAIIRRSLVPPAGMLDISYKVFLLSEAGDKVVRRFVVEQTLPLAKGDAKYLLCEQVKNTGGHITYPYGWVTEAIAPDELQKAVVLVLDGKLGQAASSSFGR